MAQALSFIFHVEDASDVLLSRAGDASVVEVPAKDHAGVHDAEKTRSRVEPLLHDSNGTKTVELVDPISHTKLASTADDQLPPLLSMIVDGFPPLQLSKFVPEAEKILHQYVERYPSIITWDEYCRVGLSAAAWVHPGVISLDRLVMISINYTLQFLLDDIFFDSPDAFLLEQYGINRSIGESPAKIQEYFALLDAIYSQQALPGTAAIENIVWEAGRDTLALSNPEWFRIYNECVLEHHRVCGGSHADIVEGRNSNFQDLDLYTGIRGGNFGGRLVQMQIEFASNTYIPDALRANPYLVNVTRASSIHMGFSNDVFSYHKESTSEHNPRNLITLLMKRDGKPFKETMQMAIDLVNTYGRAIVDMEAQAWNPILRKHLHDVKALIAGNVYFGVFDDRYRHRDSMYPEHRDTTPGTWKLLPQAKGPGL